MSVFVLDQHHQPLMPCTEKRARLLLTRKRAVVHRQMPFVIRLKDRYIETSKVQPMALKLDPGSQTTGIALVRVEETLEGEVHHAVHLAELVHRGDAVHTALGKRAGYRRRRRSANLRYRAPRFLNRRRANGWLPPSLLSRVGNVLTWARRLKLWVPLTRIEVEQVQFDTQAMQNPEIDGTEYQRGTLFGWELRSYLLAKYGYRCAYCGKQGVPFEIDHICPKSRGGSDRTSNLALACHACNQFKGNKTGAEFGHAEVEKQAQAPFKDAAAVNVTRLRLVEELQVLGVHISAMGRGSHCRTNVHENGFPRGYLTRQKRIRGFATGDLVKAVVPKPLKTAGVHTGRVAVRASGSLRIGKFDGINAKYCQLLQRADGYQYA